MTFGGASRDPIWSRDGEWIAFQSVRDGGQGIFRQRADGSGTPEQLTRSDASTSHIPQMFSPDGRLLLYTISNGNQWTLWTMSMADRVSTAFIAESSASLMEGAFSPDGRWIAYQYQPATGFRQTFPEPFPRSGAKYLVPSSGTTAGHPYWTPKGDQLVLNAGPGESVFVPVTTVPVAFGAPINFPRTGRQEPNPSTTRRNVDVMPDGQHIIGVQIPVVDATIAPITVVLNWFEELRQRVPVQ